jgi:transposase
VILDFHIRLYPITLHRWKGQGFVFMDDNARSHIANAVQQEVAANITVLEWPLGSPNLNPIEHL